MRHTWLRCRDEEHLPLAIYVSFNRYLRLEPLLRTRSDALNVFQAWTLGRILLACDELAELLPGKRFSASVAADTSREHLAALVSRLERGISLSAEDEVVVSTLSIDVVTGVIEQMADWYERKRVIILLDDAALTLTPEYMIEFFDIVRAMKAPRVSPKASVYPGTTEYGPRFHADHEGKTVSSWLSVDHVEYRKIMGEIGTRRYPAGDVAPESVRQLLMYAAFGVPRSYLTMLREWTESQFQTEQQGTNTIIQNHNKSRLAEYRSLGLKMPRLSSLVDVGASLFNTLVEIVRDANLRADRDDGKTKQTTVGIESGDLTPLEGRMINLLIEAGLLYELPSVSHGEDRSYRRLTPHLAALIGARAFSGGGRGGSPRQVVEYLQRPGEKHPVRRKLSTLLSGEARQLVRLDLPPCQRCHTPRLSDGQKFCHHCGTKLVDDSTFTACMALSFAEVPGITEWARARLHENHMEVLGDIIALQDPGTELRKIRWVGERRAQRIVSAVESYVDEFLS